MNIVWWKWNFARYRDIDSVKCICEHDTPMYMDIFPESEKIIYHGDFDALPAQTGAIVIINGAVVKLTDIEVLNEYIKTMPWVVVFSMQDDDSDFPLHELRHSNMKIWVQSPKPGGKGISWAANNHNAFRRVPVGYTQMFRHISAEQKRIPRTLDWFFSGINGPGLRIEWETALKNLMGDVYNEPQIPEPKIADKNRYAFERQVWCNKGHWRGMLDESDYVHMTCSAKVIICRPAPCGPETGRLYEALEAGCVPIVPQFPPLGAWAESYDWRDYWEYVLGEKPPFPIINDASDLAGEVRNAIQEWPANAQRISVWWTDYKERLKKVLWDEVKELQRKAAS
jgi:hypothetical protein